MLSATLAALVPYLVGNLELGRYRCKVFLGDAEHAELDLSLFITIKPASWG